jgi:group I intron endonuclease
MNTGVYQIKNTINNKLYIGSSASKHGIKYRWKRHIKELRKNEHGNGHLQNSWNKYGRDKFSFEILELCCPKECLSKEQYYLDKLQPEYNIYKTAGSPYGRIVSEETKRKISATLKGRKHSDESKLKMSLMSKGKPKTFAHKNSVKNRLWGKNGILRLRKGTRFSGNYRFKNVKTNQEVICGKFELADNFNIDRSFVYKMCNGKIKWAKGWNCINKV